MWLYDDFVGTGLAAEYASAINNGIATNGFTLSGPASLFLNQNSVRDALISIADFGGFTGPVTLTVSNLPKGVVAAVEGQGNQQKIYFKAGTSAQTGFTTVTITGTSGAYTQTLPLSLAVSAAVGSSGSGTQVDLSSEFNLYGIYDDGTTYTTGGLDGGGYSYSANLLTGSRVLYGGLFDFGPANSLDAVGCSGQSVTVSAGRFSTLILLATGAEGNQASQTIKVNYHDGSSSQFTQSFSDWYTPQKYPNESEAVAMQYRDFQDGTKDNRTFSLYSYRFALNSAKAVQSITLPNNSHVVVLAATLEP